MPQHLTKQENRIVLTDSQIIRNKRKFFRHTCSVDIQMKIDYGRDDEYRKQGGSGYMDAASVGEKHLRVLDMGRGGLCVKAHQYLKPEAILEIEIKTAFTSPISAKAKVCWVKEVHEDENLSFLAGLAFIDMGFFNKRRLKKFLKSMAQ